MIVVYIGLLALAAADVLILYGVMAIQELIETDMYYHNPEMRRLYDDERKD